MNDAKIRQCIKYWARATSERVIFGGRLGEYKYYDMDKTVERALALARSLTAQGV